MTFFLYIKIAIILTTNLLIKQTNGNEYVQNFTIFENVSVGTKVGLIAANISETEFQLPFTLIPINGELNDFDIDAISGEIRTKLELDRESCDLYSFVVFPTRGSSIHVTIQIGDINDNSPVFTTDFVAIEMPENSPNIVRSLQPAYDADMGINSVQTYNIIKGNDHNLFSIMSNNMKLDGVASYLDLSINRELDRESVSSYSLLIEAKDGGQPALSGFLKLNISVSDVNDNHPVFNQSRYLGHVIENATIGTRILQVLATDLDSADNGRIEYLINRRQSDRNQYFRIDGNDGTIYLNKPLDFESKNAYELIVVGRDCGKQPLESVTFVTIKVLDINDNRPLINVIFLNDEQNAKITESARIGEFVARISVNDADDNLRKTMNLFNVSLSGGEGAFDLRSQDNYIYLVIVAKRLDRETKANYSLKIIVKDSGSPPLETFKDIELEVTDINDNAPEFIQNIYYATISEADSSDVFVTQVFAKDLDDGINSLVNYRLENESQQFKINAKTGIISTRTRLDCEVNPNPILTVIAHDNGAPQLSASATVFVSILGNNENEPVFEKPVYTLAVDENVARGHCIAKVFANDLDCGKNAIVNYTIEEDNEQVKQQQLQQQQVYDFQVNVTNGEICISQQLDYETQRRYEFPVIATDQGGLRSSAIIQVQINDINDNRPIFEPSVYKITIRKDKHYAKNTHIAIIRAFDLDTLNTLTYRILNNNHGHLIRINHSSGDLILIKTNFYDIQHSVITLNISVLDNFGLSSETNAKVEIHFVDFVNFQPIFDKFVYDFKIREDADVMSVIGSVSARNDFNQNLQYSIAMESGNYNFDIDSNTGSIRLVSKLDYESKKYFLFTVKVANGPKFAYCQVHIEIIDVNDNEPRFLMNPIRLNIPENWSLKTPFYTAKAFDLDFEKNSILTYALLSADADIFKINKFTGEIWLQKALDYESRHSYSLLIQAKDDGAPAFSSNLSVRIAVVDVNDNAPNFVKNEYFMDVYESLKINSLIIQVQASDKDSGNNGKINYNLAKNSASHKFEIDRKTGWLKLKSALDREQISHYDVEIIAHDNGIRKLSTDAKIRLNILDVNDNDPKFSKSFYEFEIPESDGDFYTSRFVGLIQASDADIGPNALLKYFILTKNCSFTINSDTGEIFVTSLLDREQKEFHNILVEVQDQGLPKRSSKVLVRINITDINDNVPVIVDPQDDLISVREEQPIGTTIVKIRATDADLGDNASITYSLIETKDSDGFVAFAIDEYTGEIRTRIVLNHESKPIYRLAVAATDGGLRPKKSIRILRVEVLDINDNRPTFSSTSINFNVPENVPIGYVIGKVLSLDTVYQNNFIDSDNMYKHVTFNLISLIDHQLIDDFRIDRFSGDLIVIKKLDYEKTSKYHFEIHTTDLSTINNPKSNSIIVDINILDINDNSPKFETNLVTLYVPENTKIGTVIYNFTANDLDSKENGQVRYYLKWNNARQFALDEFTGGLEVADYLDYENCSEFLIIIEACDQTVNQSERLTDSLIAKIIVIDNNDNKPEFIYPKQNTISVLGQQINIGSTIIHIVAIDRDSGNNGRVSYSIVNSNEDRKFTLNYESGALVAMKPLWDSGSNLNNGNNQHKTFYTLNISAIDHGIPSKESYFVLNLTLDETGGRQTRFYKNYYHIQVLENVTVGLILMKLEYKNINYEENLTYFLAKGIANDTFDVDSKSGIVKLLKSLDREISSFYSVPIFLIDERTGDFDIVTLMISVLDVNDFVPKFSKDSCKAISVQENNPFSLIHTVVAYDLDEDDNAVVTYDIIDGNSDNKFELNDQTGELFVSELDRESQPKYELKILASDHGTSSMTSTCLLSIFVEDVNDNQPIFEQEEYQISIDENIDIGLSIMAVRAVDRDVGQNGKIIYSLMNEGQYQFRIDNKTGIIYTNGNFDREQKNSYEFYAIARDNAKSDSKSSKVLIRVLINDLNDNKPKFNHNLYKVQVPSNVYLSYNLITVHAVDADIGINSEIHYKIKNDYDNNFHINHVTGSVTVAKSLLNKRDSVIYLTIIASDNNESFPLSSQCLIEIVVGNISDSNGPKLEFRMKNESISLKENALVNTVLSEITAVRSDGRRQEVKYRIVLGNNDGDENFAIDDKGRILVKKSNFDYEERNDYELVIEAMTIGNPQLVGFYTLLINIENVNDNSPRFSQEEYRVEVMEGKRKGVFVAEVNAVDFDKDQNSEILYHIVDGNHENAFVIDSSSSGILRTNVVLDREIRDQYKLTIIATDSGIPQMTGTTTLVIDVLDFNDNAPTFPPHKRIEIDEGIEIGNILATITANDVDIVSQLNYKFDANNDNDIFDYFTINSFNGNIMLKKQLDYESRHEYAIKIIVSDTIHEASTILHITVLNGNDNQPVFQQNFYLTTISELELDPNISILKINASDLDNSELTYKITPEFVGFKINNKSGEIFFNYSKLLKYSKKQQKYYLLTVEAYDSLTTKTSIPLLIRMQLDISNKAQIFVKDYKLQIMENTLPGSVLLKFFPDTVNSQHKYRIEIVSGNYNNTFEISLTNELVLLKELDREILDSYKLNLNFINNEDQHETNVFVIIEVDDVNDNKPIFGTFPRNITISEDIAVGSVLVEIKATDLDLKQLENEYLNFSIISGDENNFFRIDPLSGNLIVRKRLDYDNEIYGKNFRLIVQCCDSQDDMNRLCSIETVYIILKDVNDNKPKFPREIYYEFVAENEPIGTGIGVVQATDEDVGVYGVLNYSISAISDSDELWKLFRIDSRTGLISSNIVFDYEYQNKYSFVVNANDIDGNLASVNVYVFVESRDEFHPQFSQRTYRFYLSGNLQIGKTIGYIKAIDNDRGIDGRLVYSLSTPNPLFRINASNGAVIVKKPLDYQTVLDKIIKNQEVSLIVSVSSGKENSLTNMSVVEISFDKINGTGLLNEDESHDWIFGLVIALILLLIIFGGFLIYFKWYEVKKKHQMLNNTDRLGMNGNNNCDSVNGNNQPKSTLNTSNMTVSSNNYVDPASFENLRDTNTVGNHFSPPKYDEIPSYGLSLNGSEVSERSRSSGRGSAEDGDEIVDEEIRMINEKPQLNITKEYLAKLGVISSSGETSESSVSSSKKSKSKVSINGSLSSIIHSSGHDDSSNWTDRIGGDDWGGPQYQPLAHVFTEIARLKGSGGDVASVHSGVSNVQHNKSNKTFVLPIPPLLNSSNRKITPAPRHLLSSQGKLSLTTHNSPVLYDVTISNNSGIIESDLGGNGIAMVPHFSQSMSPLTSKSPNCSPIMPKIAAPSSRLINHDSPLTLAENEIRI